MQGQAEIAKQALDLFASIYDAEAGNLALKTLSLDGVFVGGGIAPKLITKLQDGTFTRVFTNKGRYKRLMSRIPVKVIMNQHMPCSARPPSPPLSPRVLHHHK